MVTKKTTKKAKPKSKASTTSTPKTLEAPYKTTGPAGVPVIPDYSLLTDAEIDILDPPDRPQLYELRRKAIEEKNPEV